MIGRGHNDIDAPPRNVKGNDLWTLWDWFNDCFERACDHVDVPKELGKVTLTYGMKVPEKIKIFGEDWLTPLFKEMEAGIINVYGWRGTEGKVKGTGSHKKSHNSMEPIPRFASLTQKWRIIKRNLSRWPTGIRIESDKGCKFVSDKLGFWHLECPEPEDERDGSPNTGHHPNTTTTSGDYSTSTSSTSSTSSSSSTSSTSSSSSSTSAPDHWRKLTHCAGTDTTYDGKYIRADVCGLSSTGSAGTKTISKDGGCYSLGSPVASLPPGATLMPVPFTCQDDCDSCQCECGGCDFPDGTTVDFVEAITFCGGQSCTVGNGQLYRTAQGWALSSCGAFGGTYQQTTPEPIPECVLPTQLDPNSPITSGSGSLRYDCLAGKWILHFGNSDVDTGITGCQGGTNTITTECTPSEGNEKTKFTITVHLGSPPP